MIRSISFIIAIISGLTSYYLLSRKDAELAQAPSNISSEFEETAFVLTFTKDLTRGTLTSSDDFTWEPRVRDIIPDGTITTSSIDSEYPYDVIGKFLRNDISTGDYVRPVNLINAASGFMSIELKPGMRAVAIRVSNDKLAGGFVLPNDSVDVVHTLIRDLNNDGFANGVAKTILTNVRVLAVGDVPTSTKTGLNAEQQASTANNTNDRFIAGDTVTLEVTAEQALILNSAAASGTLSLSLIPIADRAEAAIGDLTGLSEKVDEGTRLSVLENIDADLEDLVSKNDSTLSKVMNPDMRAVAVRVSNDKLAGGFVLPNDRVDVIHTLIRDRNNDGFANGVANTILKNIRVLAVGDVPTTNENETMALIRASNDNDDRYLLGDTVTLEVTEEQALIINSAAATGTLSLSLIPVGNHSEPTIGDLSDLNEAVESTFVLVFSRSLDRGTLTDRNDFIWEPRAKDNIPAGTITTNNSSVEYPADVVGKILRNDSSIGDYVRQTNLTNAMADNMSIELNPGMRAVAILVSNEKLAGGFVLPNDRVDVIHTLIRDRNNDGFANGVASAILKNIRVLAVGDVPTSTTPEPTASQSENTAYAINDGYIEGDTVTLEVTSEQVLILNSAAASGALSLSLIPYSDHSEPSIGDLSDLNEAITIKAPEDGTNDEISQASSLIDNSDMNETSTVKKPFITMILTGQEVRREITSRDE